MQIHLLYLDVPVHEKKKEILMAKLDLTKKMQIKIKIFADSQIMGKHGASVMKGVVDFSRKKICRMTILFASISTAVCHIIYFNFCIYIYITFCIYTMPKSGVDLRGKHNFVLV